MAQTFRQIGRTLNDAWHSVSEGWRELVARCSSALTHFRRQRKSGDAAAVPAFPQWGVLAGEVIDRDRSVIVQVEMPGMTRDDCEITVRNRALRIRGEKRVAREHVGGSYYVMERAYGSFERVVPLPADVDPESARATLRHGVLRVELDKKLSPTRRLIAVK